MTTSTVQPEIARFAAAVRVALADLSAEEVDDLTDGLEADLAESLAEDLSRTLPDPVAYAAELRLAAGLPGRSAGRGTLAGLADAWSDAQVGVKDAIARNPALASMAEFVDSVRPAWWTVRAWLATWLSAAFFGMEAGYWFEGVWWIVLLGFVLISVQWGRGRWTFPGLRGLVVAGNVIAAIALVPVLNASNSWGAEPIYVGDEAGSGPEGLSMNGEPVDNIYAYDAAGNPVKGIQLFDVDGKPIVPDLDVDTTSMLHAPAMLETGVEAYNVYPLAVTKIVWDELGDPVPDPSPDPDKAAAYANGPFVKVPAVQPPPAAAPAQPVATPND
jgi:hypothetical protein